MVIFHSHVNVYQRVLFIGHLQWKTKGETRYPIFGDHPSNSTSQQVPFGEMPCLRVTHESAISCCVIFGP